MQRSALVIQYADVRFDVLAPSAVCEALGDDPTIHRPLDSDAGRARPYDVVVSRVAEGHLIEGGGERELLRTVSPRLVAESVRVLCNRLTVLLRPDEWTLHAGCVAADDTAVVLMAPSGTGKSTITAHLVTRGWAYMSDELARIEAGAARVRAFPKPMSLSDRSLHMIGAVRRSKPKAGADDGRAHSNLSQRWSTHSAEDLGGSVRSEPSRLGAIAVLRRVEGDDRDPHIEPMAGAERAAAILANQTNFFEAGDALEKVHRLVTTVPMARVVIGDMARTERVLIDWLATGDPPIEGGLVGFDASSGQRSVDPSMAFGPMSLPLRAPSTAAIEFADHSVLVVDRAVGGYLATQRWALRLLERADGCTTVERMASAADVPSSAAIEFFRGAELAGMLDSSGTLVGASP